MAEENNSIKGKELDKPLQFKGEDVKIKDITIQRNPFQLEQHEFYILTKSSSEIKDWYKRLFQIALGAFLTLASKAIYILYQLGIAKSTAEVNKIEFSLKVHEIIFFGIALFVGLILYGLSFIVKSEKDELIDQIKKYFKNSAK